MIKEEIREMIQKYRMTLVGKEGQEGIMPNKKMTKKQRELVVANRYNFITELKIIEAEKLRNKFKFVSIPLRYTINRNKLHNTICQGGF